MKQLEVQIMGQSYLLGCPDGGDQRLLEAVERVDGAMCKIRDGGKIRARDRIAVLAALNLAFDLTDHSANVPASFAAPSVPVVQEASLRNDSSTEQGQLLSSLLERLDAALGDDGRLI